ncbi:MAG TPA: OmpA family protein, partial [Kofleriaceae bacterium]|nr:OmpA family protein [Kofleriaceae bacterium]
GILDVEWADVTGHLDLDLGLWIGYENDPLNVYQTMDDGSRERVGSVVSDRIGSDLVAAFDVWHRLQVGVALPLILSQSADLGNAGMGVPALSGFGIGDLRLTPKVALLKQSRGAPVSIAVLVGVTVPTSSTSDYGGDKSATFSPELAISRGWAGGLRLAVGGGYHSRKATQALDLVVDDELFVRAGLGYAFAKRGGPPIELDGTFAMATAADDPLGTFNRNAAEAKAGIDWDPTAAVRLFAAGGLGVAEGFGTPDWRALVGVRLKPVPAKRAPVVEHVVVAPPPPAPPADRDHDGIVDTADQCPDDPEDLDGFADSDGCPDPDNDGDTVLDAADQCRDQPGTVANDGCPEPDTDADGLLDRVDACPKEPGPVELKGCPDRDGDTVADNVDNCPDEPGTVKNQGCKEKQLVKITGDKLEILDVVYFKLDKAIIEKRSFKLLDNVASVLSSHPNIQKVRVEGHTDSQGSDAYNKDLSQRRADAVRTYLITQGIDAGRLEAVGYGEERPIADNSTKKGRAANRRVEFVILGDSTGIEQTHSGPTDDTMEL